MLGKTLEDPSVINFLARFNFEPQHNKPFEGGFTNVAFGTSMRQYIVPIYFLLNGQGEIETVKLFMEREFADDAELSPAAYEITKTFLATFMPSPLSQELINELTWRNFKGGVAYTEFSDILPEQLPADAAPSFLTLIGEQDSCRQENPDGTTLLLENTVVQNGKRYVSVYACTPNGYAALFG